MKLESTNEARNLKSEDRKTKTKLEIRVFEDAKIQRYESKSEVRSSKIEKRKRRSKLEI